MISGLPATADEMPPAESIIKDGNICYWIVRPDVFDSLEIAWTQKPLFLKRIADSDSLINIKDSLLVNRGNFITTQGRHVHYQSVIIERLQEDLAKHNGWWERNDQWVTGIAGVVITFMVVR